MTYRYREEKGFIASLVKDNLTFYGRDLLAFEALDFSDDAVRQAAKRFTRIALKPYLGDKPLKKPRVIHSKYFTFKIMVLLYTPKQKTKKCSNHYG